jgi:hypothetical protein
MSGFDVPANSRNRLHEMLGMAIVVRLSLGGVNLP